MTEQDKLRRVRFRWWGAACGVGALAVEVAREATLPPPQGIDLTQGYQSIGVVQSLLWFSVPAGLVGALIGEFVWALWSGRSGR